MLRFQFADSIHRLNVRVSLQFIALRSLGIVNSAYLYGKYWKFCTDSEKYWKKIRRFAAIVRSVWYAKVTIKCECP